MTKGRLSSTPRVDHCAIIEAHNAGLSLDELCSKFGTKKTTINRIIKNYDSKGLSLVLKTKRYKSKLTKDQLSKVICYYKSSSKTLADVQKFIFYMFGQKISRQTVSNYLKKTYLHNPEVFNIESEDEPQHYSKQKEFPNTDSTTSDEFSQSPANFLEVSMMTPEDTETESSFHSES